MRCYNPSIVKEFFPSVLKRIEIFGCVLAARQIINNSDGFLIDVFDKENIIGRPLDGDSGFKAYPGSGILDNLKRELKSGNRVRVISYNDGRQIGEVLNVMIKPRS